MEYLEFVQKVRSENDRLHIFDIEPPGNEYALERYWDGTHGEGKNKPKYIFGIDGTKKFFYVEIWAKNAVWLKYGKEFNILERESSLQIYRHKGKSTSFQKKINFAEKKPHEISVEVEKFILHCESIIERNFFNN